MPEWLGIEELALPATRPHGSIPAVPGRLLDAIRKHGPIEPVVARKLAARRYEILGNPETWLAAQRLGQRTVPVEVLPEIDDEEAAEIVDACFANKDNHPLEEAQRLTELLDDLGGRSKRGAIQRLAAVTGLSRSYVSHALRLLNLSGEVQDLLRAGQITAGHAKLLVSIGDRRRQVLCAQRIVADRMSVRAAEVLTRSERTGGIYPDQTDSTEPDPDIARLERVLTDTLGAPTRLDQEGGRLIVDYGRNLDVLDGILNRLGIEDF